MMNELEEGQLEYIQRQMMNELEGRQMIYIQYDKLPN